MNKIWSDINMLDFNWQGFRDDSQYGHAVRFNSTWHIELFLNDWGQIHWYCLDPLFYESFRYRYNAVLSQRVYTESDITSLLEEFAQKWREVPSIMQ